MDFTPYFEKYKVLVKAADDAFLKVAEEFPKEVRCKVTCSDCCHALFDLSLIEALYINTCFKETLKEEKQTSILEKANRIDRQIYKIKRNAYKKLQAGGKEEEIIAELALERARCPLLNSEEQCDLYAFRPMTCRFYGIPTAIGGAGHTCGLSGFEKGKAYPTINLDSIHGRLYALSAELVEGIKSKHVKMKDVLVPLSMSLLTDYTEKYLGIPGSEPEGKKE